MSTLSRNLRRALRSPGMKTLVAAILILGAIVLFLISRASANTPWFSADLPTLLGAGVVMVLLLILLVGYQLLMLRRRLKAGIFGAKLTLRLLLLFSLVAVVPGVVVYGVSVQFLLRSIETWFDVRVDKALEGGLSLGRVNLDKMLGEIRSKADSMSQALAERTIARQIASLNLLREQVAVHEATLLRTDGSVITFSSASPTDLMPALPSASVMTQARMQHRYSAIEAIGEGILQLRVLVQINDLTGRTLLLQLVQPVPPALARDAQIVQETYRDYQQLSLSRLGLKRLYALSLTLSLMLALMIALLLAIVFSERLSAPLGILAAGTRAVAQGDFSQRQTVKSQDELGMLTESFNTMTMQLADAQAEARRNQEQLATANEYLQSILGNLSTGVLSFDAQGRLRSANRSAGQILGMDMAALIGAVPESWPAREPRLTSVSEALVESMSKSGSQPWERQIEIISATGEQVLLLRGTRLTAGADSGLVLVFDDITRLLHAQRQAAWGEVAKRLAHEIKNPLTPIQLSAERLQHRLEDKLTEPESEILLRSTQTIVSQVSALKAMVDDFSQYARSPEPKFEALDLNKLIRDVIGLYETPGSPFDLEMTSNLPEIVGDAAKLRQVIHNLLQNAEQAVAEVGKPKIVIRTEVVDAGVRLTLLDNGPGFPEALMGRVFEPYITTKPKGTGLGLAIVKKIVEEHRGGIAISNLPGGGASVTLDLPRAQPVARLVERRMTR
jgi:PAS domain S-box-containing protein